MASGARTEAKNFKLSPSDFAFLWEECKRCFYLKVNRGFGRPPAPFPKIFGTIDKQMKACFEGRRSEELAPDAPSGVVQFGDGWVQSTPIRLDGRRSTCFIRGIFDSVLKLDDGTYAVIDFKTTDANTRHAGKYGRQLHAYALALESAAPGNTALSPVSRLGLVIFEPGAFHQERRARASLAGSLTWVEIDRKPEAFLQFLGEVMDVLEQPEPPRGSCEVCQYRDKARATGW